MPAPVEGPAQQVEGEVRRREQRRHDGRNHPKGEDQ
jgi:hypothetical protein